MIDHDRSWQIMMMSWYTQASLPWGRQWLELQKASQGILELGRSSNYVSIICRLLEWLIGFEVWENVHHFFEPQLRDAQRCSSRMGFLLKLRLLPTAWEHLLMVLDCVLTFVSCDRFACFPPEASRKLDIGLALPLLSPYGLVWYNKIQWLRK